MVAVAFGLLVPLLAACGSSGSSAARLDAASAVATSIPAKVPAGTTLRVGDQVQLQETVLASGAQDHGFPYSVKWASFIGGPSMLQAFHANAIDVGFVADTPLIFAQAAHQDVVAVAAWASEHGSDELVAAPGSHITSWADLKGKRVAYQQGTVLEATVLQGLEQANLTLHDLKSVNLPFTQIVAALQNGSVDAGILAPPLDGGYLSSHPDAKVIERPDNLTARVSFLVASRRALQDPAKAAAIRDYILRLGRAYNAIRANPGEFVQRFYVEQYHLTPTAGRALLAKLGTSSFVPLTGALVPAQQALADLYLKAGEVPSKLDAKQEFDLSFAKVIQQVIAQ
ncbi:MAG TPA: ABC transporter substrate-binding protein [Acidimicrobiia bacterium]|nr:ABC transporter substrate-binding protein [Acidimicrobiia bacterium]